MASAKLQPSTQTTDPEFTVCAGRNAPDLRITDYFHEHCVRHNTTTRKGDGASIFQIGVYSAGRSDEGPNSQLFTPAMTPLANTINFAIRSKLDHAMDTFTGSTGEEFYKHAITVCPIDVGAPKSEAEIAMETQLADAKAEIARLQSLTTASAAKKATPTGDAATMQIEAAEENAADDSQQ